MSKTLTCITCPRGCQITVSDDFIVTGNFCPRGKEYALNEVKNPLRVVTSSVRVGNRDHLLVSVKTSKPIPKGQIFNIMNEIKLLKVDAPVIIGQVILHNPLGLDTDIVITKNID